MKRFTNLRRGIVSARPFIDLGPGDNIISFTGSGYFGSTYVTSSNAPGQWHADGQPIPGATNKSYVMTAENDGKIITYVNGDGPSNQIQMWTPAAMGSALVCWYDAALDSSFTYGTGTQISSWANRVSGAVPAIQTNASKRPTRDVNGMGTGYPAVVANGIFQQFTMASLFAPSNQHFFTVIKTTDTKTNGSWWNCPGIWGNEIGGYPNDFGFGLQAGYPIFGATNTALVPSTSTINDGLAKVLSYSRTSTGSVSIVRNGSTMTSGSTASGDRVLGGNGITSMFQMGSDNTLASGSSRYLSASLSEFIIFNQVLSTLDKQRMEGFCVWRWNLTSVRNGIGITHPFRNTPPRIL